MFRVFVNGPGDLGSIPGRVIPKTQKMVLDTTLLNNHYYKVRVKGKVEKSSPTLWCSSYWKKEPSGHPWLQSPTLLYFYLILMTCKHPSKKWNSSSKINKRNKIKPDIWIYHWLFSFLNFIFYFLQYKYRYCIHSLIAEETDFNYRHIALLFYSKSHK